jgi:ABC-type multidrug transport system ATPase subunit
LTAVPSGLDRRAGEERAPTAPFWREFDPSEFTATLKTILTRIPAESNQASGFCDVNSVITAKMPPPAIAVDSLEKYFPPSLSGWRALLLPVARPTHCALAGVTFQVKRGEAVAIVGANGAGKSTLLRILATLVSPTRGRAMLGGFDVEHQGARARQRLGYHTGGDEGFYGRLTARENLAFFAAMNNLAGADACQRIHQIAEWMGISGELDRPARMLSTGITHRLGLARAMLHGPEILLLDEPTRSLDPLAAADFRRLLKQEIVQRRGTTLLFASHTLSEVEQIADRMLLLAHGRALACDSPQSIRATAGAATLEAAIAQLTRMAPAAMVTS